MVIRSNVWDWSAPSSVSAREADWDTLYAEELPRVYNFFRYRVGDGAVAEDLTAITFEKAWRARARYRRDVAAFSTWLFTIARNVAADHFRRGRPETTIDAARDLPANHSPEADALRKAEFARLSAVLATLTARDRELLALKYGAEMTNRAIAQVTGIGESNVGTILHRAIATLRERW